MRLIKFLSDETAGSQSGNPSEPPAPADASGLGIIGNLRTSTRDPHTTRVAFHQVSEFRRWPNPLATSPATEAAIPFGRISAAPLSFVFYYRGRRVFVFCLISRRDAAIAGLSE